MSLLKNCRCIAATLLTPCVMFGLTASVEAQSVNLMQFKNGRPDVAVPSAEWGNGNANAIQSHFLTGHSTAYRAHITGLTPSTAYWIRFRYDTKLGGKNTWDFLTHYDRLEPHIGFAHTDAEDVNPLEGLVGTFGSPSTMAIPVPAAGGWPTAPTQPVGAFNALPADERLATIWNGAFTGITYISQGTLNADDAETIVEFAFTTAPSATVVVIAFGGHIATEQTWGEGNTAAALPGSSYHIDLNACSFGCNGQTLQLSATAVQLPPDCFITSPDLDGLIMCPGETATFEGPEGDFDYEWSITKGGCASFDTAAASPGRPTITLSDSSGGTVGVGGSSSGFSTADGTRPGKIGTAGGPTGQSVEVTACSDCGSFVLNLTVTSGGSSTTCSITVDVGVDAPVTIENCADVGTTIDCGDPLPAPYTTVAAFVAATGATLTSSCDLTISNTPDPTTLPSCGTVVRTYTITDACGATVTCDQTFTFVDSTPPTYTNCPASVPAEAAYGCIDDVPVATIPNATEGCSGIISNVYNGETVSGEGCSDDPKVITRSWTATNGCGGTTTCTQIINVIDDDDPIVTCPADVVVECSDLVQSEACPVGELGNCLWPIATTEAEFEALQQDGSAGGTIDDCNDVTVAWVSDVQTSKGAECPVVYTRTYRITDSCDNEVECTQEITLIDTTAPNPCCYVPEVVGCFDFPITLIPPIYTDECGMTIVPVARLGTADGEVFNPNDYSFPVGETIFFWTAGDQCGNASDPIEIKVIMNDCPTYSTRTQSEWAGDTDTAEFVLDEVGDLIVGRNSGTGPRSMTIQDTDADCLALRLPAAGSPVAFPSGYGNQNLDNFTCNTDTALPLNGDKFVNSLLGETIALGLNLYIDPIACPDQVGSLILCSVMTSINDDGVVKTQVIPESVLLKLGSNRTVTALLGLANDALAGKSVVPTTISSINTAVNRVNALFSDGGVCVALLSTSCSQAATAPVTVGLHSTPTGESDPTGGEGTGVEDDGSAIGEDDSSNTTGVVNSGTIAPALTEGVTIIDSDFTQTAEGSLIIQLRGEDAPTRCDLLTVDGDADLHGTLVVDVTAEFIPIIGEEFQVVAADSVTGAFDHLVLADLAGDPYLNIRYTPNSVMVDVKTSAVIAGDLDRNGRVDVADLLAMLRDWGTSKAGSDANGDGTVNASDLMALLGNWGTHTTSAQ